MKKLICIVCPVGCHLEVDVENDYHVTGNSCPKGAVYGRDEMIAPTRVVTSTVVVVGGIHRRVPVKTAAPIPKGLIFQCMKELNKVVLHSPVNVGDVVIKDVLGTGVNIVVTRSM